MTRVDPRIDPRQPALGLLSLAYASLVLALAPASVASAKPQVCDTQLLFKAGTSGYHSFRIPSIVRSTKGTLIAFAEGRRDSGADYGNIDVVMRRSRDHGRTWGRVELVFSKHGDTCGNPTAVVDQATGAIWLFASWNAATHSQAGRGGLTPIDAWGQRRVYSLVSYDDGSSWKLQNRTRQLVPRNYTWDAVGPGVGIQLRGGPVPGRLIIPAIGRNIISDDHGATWRYELLRSAAGTPLTGTSEAAIAELADGSLYRNDRPATGASKRGRRRMVSRSNRAHTSFTPFAPDCTLLDPVCQASLLVYTGRRPHRLLFLNPADTERRIRPTVRVSYDGGRTWALSRQLPTSRAGYTSMTKTANYRVATLVEVGKNASGGHSIRLYLFNLPWLLNGRPEPQAP